MGKIFDQATEIVGWTPREQRVLELMFGEQKSMNEVAIDFNVTRNRIWQIQRKALSR